MAKLGESANRRSSLGAAMPMSDEQGTMGVWPQLDLAKNLMAPLALRWDRCCAYLRGDQLIGYQTGREDLTPADGRKRRNKVVVNQLLNIHRQVCARLITDYPAMAALPASNAVDDIAKAQASEEALRWFWDAANMRVVLRKAIEWLTQTGTVALRTRWDTSAKKVVVDYVRSYDLRFEPYANDPDESSWIGVVTYVSKEDLLAQYPEHKEQLLDTATPATRYYTYGPRSLPQDRYELIDVYHRDGRHEVWAGGVRCFETTTPGNRLPVRVIRYTEVMGYLWGLGLLEPLLDSQDLYNSMRTQILANAKLTGNPKVMVPEEAEVKAGAFTDVPGEKVKYKGGISPHPFSIPPLSQYIVEQPAQILSEMYDQGGIHGTSLGKRVVGMSSGVAINATSKNDAQQLQLTMDAIENGVREMAIDVLTYMRAYLDESRFVRMLDSSGKMVWSELSNTRLLDDPEVFLEAGSLFRSEARDREARTLQFLQAGLIDKEKAKRLISSRLEPLNLLDQLASLRKGQEVLEAVYTLAAPLKVYPSDDLDGLERVFKQFMDRSEFYTLPQENQDAVDAAYSTIVQMLYQQRAGNPLPQMPAPQAPAQQGAQGRVAGNPQVVSPQQGQLARRADRLEATSGEVPPTAEGGF